MFVNNTNTLDSKAIFLRHIFSAFVNRYVSTIGMVFNVSFQSVTLLTISSPFRRFVRYLRGIYVKMTFRMEYINNFYRILAVRSQMCLLIYRRLTLLTIVYFTRIMYRFKNTYTYLSIVISILVHLICLIFTKDDR